MASLCNILNPDDGRRRTVRLIVNSMDEASTSEVPSSPGTSLVSDASDNLTVEGSSYKEHEAHPNCPNSLACLPNTDGRPQHTLPVILRCAILGSPHQRLTIREIYAAMENKYAYYRTAGPTWKQSVRHHLSLNRLFERQPRPVTNPGFGSYWTVNLSAPPGTKRPRKRGRQNKEGRNGSPLPPKKRGRPRKSALDNEQFYSLLGEDEESKHVLDGVSIPSSNSNLLNMDGWSQKSKDLGDKQEIENSQDNAYISEEECESEEEFINPMDRRNSLAALGLSAYQPSRAPQTLSLPPFSTLQSSDNIMDSLQAEISALRRQSTDAISLSLRLSDQVLQAQAEASRTHDTLRTVQQRLDEETRRRSELQRMLNNEEKKRGKAEEALKAFLACSHIDRSRFECVSDFHQQLLS
ncbi:Forkhead box protein J3 [Termitomyces sp. T112]|nr:Forkhead box protein J3 [Termitomyces sp. T112]